MIAGKRLWAVPTPTTSKRDSSLVTKGTRVIIVDDRSTARSLLEGLAKSLEPGITVETFAEPQEALNYMQNVTPDLIITDYRMPGMDGIEFTRRVRAEPNLVDVARF